ERLEKLSPEERREFVRQKLSERREKILSRLPQDTREEVEKLPPREQVEYLRRLRGEQLLKETFKDPREIEKLQMLPPATLRESLRTPAERTPPRPPFLSEETWSRWLDLKPFERVRVLRQVLESRPGGPSTLPPGPLRKDKAPRGEKSGGAKAAPSGTGD